MIEATFPFATNQNATITRQQRAALLDQQPITLWLTGLSASGKSTLAFSIERKLIELGRTCYVLDGDAMRTRLNADLGYSPMDRAENIRRTAEVARLMNDAGLIVIAALISPLRADRASARDIVGDNFFREVHISTSLAVCESRDPKGLYGMARSGKITDFTGITSPYEQPEQPVLSIDTTCMTIDEAVLQLLNLVTPPPAQ